MKFSSGSEVDQKRVAKWMLQAKPLDERASWIERRQFIDFGGHTYPLTNGQIFQCAHCGHYDPEWSAVTVLTYFKNNFGIEPYEKDVLCSVA